MILVSALAGMMNAIAGGGTLLTFPALIGLGISPIVANATSTVALWPGAVSSFLGYRRELQGARKWAMGFAAPSLIGGGVGAWLLLRTPAERFNQLVPWLVLSATTLFIVQPTIMRWIRSHDAAGDPTAEGRAPSTGILFLQFLVAIYGGYFGAGVGILMLAVLGFMGLTNIHRMNGLKNFGGASMNFVAAAMFALSGLVNWPVALAMATGSIVGGYIGSRGAQKVPQVFVRRAVVAIGLLGGLWLLLK